MNPTLNPDNMSPEQLYAASQNNSSPASTYNPDAESPAELFSKSQNTQGEQTVTKAKTLEGAADYNGLCQKFVEDTVYGKSGIYPTAVDAWNDNAAKGNAYTDLNNATPGDLVYFAPDNSNGGAGHTGVYMGDGKMISATYNGVQVSDINQWTTSTGQKPLGYVKPQ